MGLCDAASAILLNLDRVPSVRGLVLVNPWVRSEYSYATTQLKHYYSARLLSRAFWGKLLAGRLNWNDSVRSYLRTLRRAISSQSRVPPEGSDSSVPYQAHMAQGLRRFDGQVLLALSGDDLTAKEFLEHAGTEPVWSGLLAQSRIKRIELPEADHTFSRALWRHWIEDETLAWLENLSTSQLPVAPPGLRRETHDQDGTAASLDDRVSFSALSRFQRSPTHAALCAAVAFVWVGAGGGHRAHEHAFERTAEDLLGEIPAGIRVARATAPDCARHFAILGRYPSFLARPDRWRLWAFFATRIGVRLIEELKPDAIWSTYPIATAHVIGAALQRLSGLPWIADFRDPMAQNGYPPDPKTWHSYRKIEQTAVDNAARCVFVTRGARTFYERRFGAEAAQRFELIENGYDESSFLL